MKGAREATGTTVSMQNASPRAQLWSFRDLVILGDPLIAGGIDRHGQGDHHRAGYKCRNDEHDEHSTKELHVGHYDLPLTNLFLNLGGTYSGWRHPLNHTQGRL